MAEFWAQIRHTSDQETVLLGGILGGGPGADPEHAALLIWPGKSQTTSRRSW